MILNDCIYCIGGDVKYVFQPKGVDCVWKLNSKEQTSEWEQVASMNVERCGMGAAVYDDTIVVAGGCDANYHLLASTEVYQTFCNEWRIISPLKQRKSGNALVSCNGFLYALGGWDGYRCLSSVEKLGDLKGEWCNIEPMKTPRKLLAAVNCDGAIYAIGGQSGKEKSTSLKTVEKYDSTANTWKDVRHMNFKRRFHAACVLRNKIYVIGGIDPHDNEVTEIECYDPILDTWSNVGKSTEKLWFHTLVAV